MHAPHFLRNIALFVTDRWVWHCVNPLCWDETEKTNNLTINKANGMNWNSIRKRMNERQKKKAIFKMKNMTNEYSPDPNRISLHSTVFCGDFKYCDGCLLLFSFHFESISALFIVFFLLFLLLYIFGGKLKTMHQNGLSRWKNIGMSHKWFAFHTIKWMATPRII